MLNTNYHQPLQACHYLYVMGAESGVGKSTVCLGLLATLLASGIPAYELAYIKPMTQCLEIQAVTRFCNNSNIAVNAIDGLVFSKGFTRQFIAGLTETSPKLLAQMLTKIQHISRDKKYVIIDGMGGPASGSEL